MRLGIGKTAVLILKISGSSRTKIIKPQKTARACGWFFTLILVLKPPHFNKWVNSFLDKRGATHHGHKIGANNRVFCLTPSAKRGAEAIAKAL
jgi:hypothetical protein